MLKIIRRDSQEAEEFTPHLAMTSMALNGGAANLENKPISLKSQSLKPISKSELDMIEKLEGKEACIKATYQNLRSRLESAIETHLATTLHNYCYWVYVRDFDDKTVVFELSEKLYRIDYSVGEGNSMVLGDTLTEVFRSENYADIEDGEQVFTDTPSTPEKGNSPMSEINLTAEEFQAKLDEAADAAVQKHVELQKQETLTKSTKDALEALTFIDKSDGSVEGVLKSILASDDGLFVLKSLQNAQAAVTKAAEDVVKAVEEKEAIKEKFSVQTSIEDLGNGEQLTPEQKLAKAVAAAKSKDK